jgi:hypothetical protein
LVQLRPAADDIVTHSCFHVFLAFTPGNNSLSDHYRTTRGLGGFKKLVEFSNLFLGEAALRLLAPNARSLGRGQYIFDVASEFLGNVSYSFGSNRRHSVIFSLRFKFLLFSAFL